MRDCETWNECLRVFYAAVIATDSELVAELPFILMHPKPEEEEPVPSTARPSPTHKSDGGEAPLDANLIQLDT